MATDIAGRVRSLLETQTRWLKEAKAYKGKKPPALMRGSRDGLEREFAIAVVEERKKQLQQAQALFKVYLIGEPYPPCTLPLSSLVPVTLRELTLETQHRGRVLVVRAFCQPISTQSIENAVEDELGDVEHLAVFNLLPSVSPNDILPRGAILAVKEPYYKRNPDGVLTLRVDHPSDLVPLKPGNAMIPPSLAPQVVELGVSALRWKEDGNDAFTQKNWQVAVDCYSEALKALKAEESADDDLRRTLYRNRAGAHLRLGHYEPAIADALAAMIPAGDALQDAAAKEVNIKALFRAGMAAYGLGDFGQAKHHFSQALELDAGHKDTLAELKRTEKRLAEQANGSYNFSAMSKSATETHYRLDHASFVSKTEIESAGSHGRGLFAARPVKAGRVVFVEKAFHVAHIKDNSGSTVLVNINTKRGSSGAHFLRLCGLIDKMLWNPKLAAKYLDLFDGGTFGSNKKATVVDGKVAVDTFRVQAIAEFNGFGCPRVQSSGDKGVRKANITDDDILHQSSAGIWLRASYANHSCLPNASRAFIGDMMVVRALRDIRRGEEIRMAYIDPSVPFASRQEHLRNAWGFNCGCALCVAEAEVAPEVAQRRLQLRREALEFLAANLLTVSYVKAGVPSDKRAEAKRLRDQLCETYPAEPFERLPRLDCLKISLWVYVARPWVCKTPEELEATSQEDLEALLAVLRNGGYFVTVSGETAAGSAVAIDRSSGVPSMAVVSTAVYASWLLEALKDTAASSALKAFAKEVYMALYVTDEKFETEFVGL